MSVAQGYKANTFWFLTGLGFAGLFIGAAWFLFGWEIGVTIGGLALAGLVTFVIQQVRGALRGIG